MDESDAPAAGRSLPVRVRQGKPGQTADDPTAGGVYCGAKTRAEDSHPWCGHEAGWGTDHPGTGRCKFHGGSTPARSGRFSTIHRERIRELIEQHKDDPDPLNIFPELAAARAIFEDFINRYDENSEALVAWHNSFEATRVPISQEKSLALSNVIDEWEDELAQKGSEATSRQKQDIETARAFVDLLNGKGAKTPRPRMILDVSDAMRHLDTITKIVERIEKIRAENAISRNDFLRLMRAMGAVVQKHVRDPEQLRAIALDWQELAVN